MVGVANVANRILNSKIMTCLTKPNAPSAAATIANISCITKDAVNCYYYVTQSLHNEKIPEEKRKFVAGLDLSNGILNVITQFVTGQLVINNQDKIFKKCCGEFFKEKNLAKFYEANKNVISMGQEAFMSAAKNWEHLAKTGLGVFATLFVTQIIAKRVIVPFLATPMASFIKSRFEKNEKKTANNIDIIENNQTSTNNKKMPLPECYKNFNK